MKSNNCEQLWRGCLDVIKDNITEETYNAWFKPIVPVSYQDNVFTIKVPSQFFYEYLEEKFIDLLGRTILRIIGPNTILNYRIELDGKNIDYPTESREPKPETPKNRKEPLTIDSPFNSDATPAVFDSQLNAKYLFSNFFESESNKIARVTGDAIAKNPGKAGFNPFYIHGTCGTGKTHLCHAIGHRIKDLFPEKKVLYISAHHFKVQYTNAQRFNTVNDFINFYQRMDVLIVDDIQELSGLKATQHTFFHIFNHLHLNNKQIILTSDRSPSEMMGIEDRLLTRFRACMISSIGSPDYDLRRKVLKNLIANEGLKISDEVLEYIAENVTNNIRDIEGVTFSLMAHSVIQNREIDIFMAKRIIDQVIRRSVQRNLTVMDIARVVCAECGVRTELIQTKSRKHEIVEARHLTMYLAKEFTHLSLTQIGAMVGGRNHATVLHAIKTMKDRMEVERNFKTRIDELKRKVIS